MYLRWTYSHPNAPGVGLKGPGPGALHASGLEAAEPYKTLQSSDLRHEGQQGRDRASLRASLRRDRGRGVGEFGKFEDLKKNSKKKKKIKKKKKKYN